MNRIAWCGGMGGFDRRGGGRIGAKPKQHKIATVTKTPGHAHAGARGGCGCATNHQFRGCGVLWSSMLGLPPYPERRRQRTATAVQCGGASAPPRAPACAWPGVLVTVAILCCLGLAPIRPPPLRSKFPIPPHHDAVQTPYLLCHNLEGFNSAPCRLNSQVHKLVVCQTHRTVPHDSAS